MKKAVFIITVLMFALLFSGCNKKRSNTGLDGTMVFPDDSEKVRSQFKVWLNEGVICKKVKDREPVDAATEFYTDDYIKIFCFTKMGCEKPPAAVFHRYSIFRKGLPERASIWEEVHMTELSVESAEFRTWSYKTVSPGKWRIDILAQDKESIIKTFVFNVNGPEKIQQGYEIDPNYKKGTIELVESAICENIENNVPVNPIGTFQLNEGEDFKKVWIWMNFAAQSIPVRVFLRWNRWIRSVDNNDGWSPELTSELSIKGKSFRTRGFKSCQAGKWRLDILASDGATILKTHEFSISKKKEDSI
ncbi:MAG: DUF2914 domain-containing protein [Spirochaetes bacterium]|nr:DUF2914 domain-containing protein [Spirochaetota bacterium]